MRDTHFDWKRFWVEIGDAKPSDYGDKFLDDPEGDFTYVQGSTPKTYDEISDPHCLFLLGEGGIGKTTTIKEVVEGLKKRNKNVIYQDLSGIGGLGELTRYVFESGQFKNWIDSDNEIYTFGVYSGLVETRHREGVLLR